MQRMERLARAIRQQHQAASRLRATRGGASEFDNAVTGRVLRTKQVKRHFGIIQNESEFVVKVFTGGHGQAAQTVELVIGGWEAQGCGSGLFLHT